MSLCYTKAKELDTLYIAAFQWDLGSYLPSVLLKIADTGITNPGQDSVVNHLGVNSVERRMGMAKA